MCSLDVFTRTSQEAHAQRVRGLGHGTHRYRLFSLAQTQLAGVRPVSPARGYPWVCATNVLLKKAEIRPGPNTTQAYCAKSTRHTNRYHRNGAPAHDTRASEGTTSLAQCWSAKATAVSGAVLRIISAGARAVSVSVSFPTSAPPFGIHTGRVQPSVQSPTSDIGAWIESISKAADHERLPRGFLGAHIAVTSVPAHDFNVPRADPGGSRVL